MAKNFHDTYSNVRYLDFEDIFLVVDREPFEFSWDLTKRNTLERFIYHEPEKEIRHFRSMITSWRKYPIYVVFGNLGRQPYLLNFFLDLCFHEDDDVKLICDWKLPSKYQITKVNNNIDILIVIEPPFGYTVHKPPHVNHLIVFSSHVTLHLPNGTKFYRLHLSSLKEQIPPPLAVSSSLTVFMPPIFHVKPISMKGKCIDLDVRHSETVHEAYLRILTGREICGTIPVKIQMNDIDVLRELLAVTKRRVESFYKDAWMEDIYWKGIL